MQNQEEIEFHESSRRTERSFLGAILLDNTLMDYAVLHMKPNSFVIGRNRPIFSAMVELHKKRAEISPKAILSELMEHGDPLNADERAYVASLIENVPPNITPTKGDHFQRFALLTVFISIGDTLLSDMEFPQIIGIVADKLNHLRQIHGIDPLTVDQLQASWRKLLKEDPNDIDPRPRAKAMLD